MQDDLFNFSVEFSVADLEVNQSAMEMDQMISDENVTLTIRLIMLGKVSEVERECEYCGYFPSVPPVKVLHRYALELWL